MTEDTQTPPVNLEAERAVLGSVLADRDGRAAWPVIQAQLQSPMAFYREAHRHVYEAIDGLLKDRRAVDMITVADALREAGRLEQVGGMAYLAGMAEHAPMLQAVADYARIVGERWRQREMIHRASAIVKAGYGGKSVSEMEALVGKLSMAAAGDTGDEWVDIAVAEEEAAQIRQDIADGKLQLLRIGWSPFDRLINSNYGGGLLWRQVGIIGARSGVGKTLITVDLIRRLLLRHHDLRAAIFSLEMERDALADLMTRQMCAQVERTRPVGKIALETYTEARQHMKTLHGRLKLRDTGGLRSSVILSDIRRLAADGIRVFVIDHLHIVNLGVKPEHARWELGFFTMALRDMAKELGLLIIMPAQLSKAGEVGPILLGHLAESDNIGRNIDWALGLRKAPKGTDAQRREFELHFMKNRRGVCPDDPVKMFARWRYLRFEDDMWWQKNMGGVSQPVPPAAPHWTDH